MPIYEYECQKCHHQFELMQKMNDEPVKQCPKCFQNTVVRMVSAAGFQLKGSGWYQTDFKNNAKKPGESPKDGSTQSESSSTDASATKKGDDK